MHITCHVMEADFIIFADLLCIFGDVYNIFTQ